VLATEDVLRLACLHKTKPVHYISTVGVLDRTADALAESLVVDLHDKLVGGYEQSKWVAERLVGLASERGLPVATYRPSRIVGHSRTGRMNTDDLFSRLIKGIAVQGEAPRDLGFDNILPVDLASRLIVACSLNPMVHGHAVHVVNPQWNSLDAVVDAIEAQGHPVERMAYEPWLERLAAHAKRDPGHPLASLIPVLRKLNPAADPTVGRQLPIAHEHIARWAGPALAQGLRPVDEWLRTYFEHFHAVGYLPMPAQPREHQLAA
jgi:thioester reductase-like protein